MRGPVSKDSACDHDVLVLDIGGTHIRMGHLRGGVVSDKFDSLSSSELRVENACDVLADSIIEYAGQQQLSLEAVVIGLPGMLDKENDTLAHCNNIPQLEGRGLQQQLSETLKCRVILEQDIMLQLLGEWRQGAAIDSPAVFGVYFGTGIGAAYLLNGVPQLQNAAGLQAGHIPIMAQGKPCLCGNTDCVEAYASGHTLNEMAQVFDYPVEQLFTVENNAPLQQQLDEFVRYQAYLLATIVTLHVPDMIVIGGGIPTMKKYPREKLIEYTKAQLQKPYPAQSIKFTWASLGKSSTLYGAMALLEAP